MKTICVDLDGVIAKLRTEGQSYSDVLPVDGAVAKLNSLKLSGNKIIIYTARHMKTTEANVGLVMAKMGKITLDWLQKYNVPYDEIYFGKPWADIYIDDNAYRFESWAVIAGDAHGLPESNESLIFNKKPK
jgi:capsule biosynthesis phosphatase